MKTNIFAAASVAALALLAASPQRANATTQLTTVRVASGLTRPLFVTSPPGDTARIFIVEQRGADNRGRIKILKNGVILAQPFLTTGILPTGSEQGLLGLAFAPDYATTGRFYIDYTRSDGSIVLERHNVSANPDTAISAGTVLLTIAKPAANHNGGWVAFGPDGYLYVSTGDGGDAGDPNDNAQNLNVLLGKLLRLDVGGATYTSPPSNPFAGATAGRDEIWAFGLRNPWRPCFDRLTHDLIIADVGQAAVEEIDFAPATSTGGENYGWRCYEGSNLYTESSTISCGSCQAAGCPKVFPIHEYTHSSGLCSITGGYVYRGCAIPDLQGQYFFGDYCAGKIWSGTPASDTLSNFVDRTTELAPGGGLLIGNVTSFGEDARGEIYICDSDGEVYKIVPKTGVAESDMPTLHVQTGLGDDMGATTPGNALLPGITPFAAAGGRIRSFGYMTSAGIRECASAPSNCMASHLRRWPFDIDVQACVDAPAGQLTRRFIFTNRAATSQPLTYTDVIAPLLNGDADRALRTDPANATRSATLVLFDAFQPTRYIRYWGQGSIGVSYTSDVDTASQVTARVAQDLPLGGGTSAGPSSLALALGFTFPSVPPAAAETVTVFTVVQANAPTGIDEEPTPAKARVFEVGPVPFVTDLALSLTLPEGEDASIEVFDVQGRVVRRLLRQRLAAGPYRLRWDGRTASGARAATGVYFIRYTGGGTTDVRRVVLLR